MLTNNLFTYIHHFRLQEEKMTDLEAFVLSDAIALVF